ncbi:MAG TPA: DNA internalization-related competence protein ComEC/Rec2 [Candidatus Kapabacteria bacterium]|nr:DNA internalization-related competence protein ComEC/Rec2 [Candidatus Kapabacteria bacterium]
MSWYSERKGLFYRPAIVLLASLSFGIWSASHLTSSILLYALVGSVLLLTSASFIKRSPSLRFSSLCLLAIVVGYGAYSIKVITEKESPLGRIGELRQGEVLVFGKVVSTLDSGEYNAKGVLQCDSIHIDSNAIVASERLVLIIELPKRFLGARLPKHGEYIKVYAELRSLNSPERNPYESNASRSLKRQSGANAIAIINSPYDIYTLDSAHLTIAERAEEWFADAHHAISQRLESCIGDSLSRAIATAVVLGDKNDLTKELADDFRNAGLSHILVVSGFNVAIVALVVYYLLRLLGIVRLRWRIFISMVVVAFYGFLIGFEPSILRALVSVELVFLARLLERKPDVGNITAAVASVALLLDPSQLFDPSFQLTYGAVFSLVFIYPSLSHLFIRESWRQRTGLIQTMLRASVETFLTSIAVTIGLLPVMIYHFHHVTITAVLSNIIGIPVATLLTVISFLLLPLSLVSSWLAGVYGDVVSGLSHLLSAVAKYSAGFGILRVMLPRFALLAIVLYYGVIAFVIFGSREVKNVFMKASFAVIVWVSLLLIDVPLFAEQLTPQGELSVLFFDVGQGDATLIRTPNGKAYLIDLGGIRKDGSSVAERALLPAIESEGITHLDAAFITHMHIDHYAGAVSILGSGLVDKLYVSGYPGRGYYITVFDSLVLAKHISVTDLIEGNRIELDTGVALYILNPDSSVYTAAHDGSGNEANHTSLAMKLVYAKRSILFLGDIEGVDEQRLVSNYGSFLKGDVVKVAHHGSRYSSSRELTRLAQPEYAVVSVGDHNSFGHPTIEALSRWHNASASIVRTDREGAILFHSDGNRIWREDWRK